jgi:hypothetical protein
MNRNVESHKYKAWERSFVISKPISVHIEASIKFASKPKVEMFSQLD